MRENIKMLTKCANVSEVLCIPQVENLEDELKRSCKIRDVKEFFGSLSLRDFKTDFIKEKNLMKKLKDKGFDFNKLWSQSPGGIFSGVENKADEIRRD